MRFALVLSVLLAAPLLGCGSSSLIDDPGDTDCTSNVDCESPLVCDEYDRVTQIGTCVAATVGACEFETDCGDGQTCTEGTCMRIEPAWRYVAIVSETSGANEINDSINPGPDIDAIEVVHAGESAFGTVVHTAMQGAGGPIQDGGNVNRTVSAVLGANDAIPSDGSDCDFTADPDGTFWSMGDTVGFVVVELAQPIADGDTIRIWELNATDCPNVSIRRLDAYSVYIADPGVSLANVASSRAMRGDHWLRLGESGPNGGVSEFVVTLPQED